MSLKQDKTDHHLAYLDAVRGIAAIFVMVYHYINWRYEDRMGAKIASVVFNGSDAVSFFFVLSGFVLSYKYIALGQPLDIKKFYINRIFRLWPAFFVTIVLNALNWNRQALNGETFINVFVLNKTHFWDEALLLRASPQYYTPGWTLVIELAVSFFIPFMILLALKSRKVIYWLITALLLIGNNMGDFYKFHVHFALGVLLSCVFYSLRDVSFRETKWYRYRYALLAVSFVLFSVRHIDRMVPFGETYTRITKYFGIDFFHYTGLASFVFIAAILCSRRLQRFLNNGLLRFFGKISYGIYLMHWLLVTDVFVYWDQLAALFPGTKVAFVCILLLYSCATFVLATLLHYVVEKPFINIGRRIAKRLRPAVIT